MVRFSWMKHLFVILLIGVPLSMGAYFGFPVFDDAYYSLLLKEQGPAAMVAAHGDRPLFGLVLQWFAVSLGSSVLPLVAVNLCLWAAFALQAAWLWRLMYPAYKDYSLLVCCLVLAPMVVQVHAQTVVGFVASLLPVLLSYGCLLLILLDYERQTRTTTAFRWVGCALAALGVLISEYGLAAAIICAVIAAGYVSPASAKLSRLRRLMPAVSLLLCVAGTYALFLQTTDPTMRSNVTPQYAATRLSGIFATAFNVIRGGTYALIGSYGGAVARVQPNWGSKWSVAALVYGLVVGFLLSYMTASRRLVAPISAEASGSKSFTLPVAILAGLGPAAWMGRDLAQSGFASRFLLPVLPVCVMATILLSLRVVKPSYHHLVLALFGFIAGYGVIDAAVKVTRDQKLAESIGAALLPHVRQATGLVVAVCDTRGSGEFTFTSKVTRMWPKDLSHRVWLVEPSEARRLFGSPTMCRDHPSIERDLRTIQRSGAVGTVLAVYGGATPEIQVETYCASASDPRIQPSASISRSNAPRESNSTAPMDNRSHFAR